MSVVEGRFEELRRMQEQLHSMLEGAQQPSLKGGDGGGTSGGMETRVAKLEAHVEQLRADVGDVRKSAGELKVQGATIVENLRHLPTKPWIFSVCLGLLAAIGGIVALIVRFLPHAS